MQLKLKPGDFKGAERVALAYIEEEGDLPEGVWYQLGFIQDDDNRNPLWDRLEEIRAEYWRKLGKPMPPYKGGWV
jgi:hypothetical protein